MRSSTFMAIEPKNPHVAGSDASLFAGAATHSASAVALRIPYRYHCAMSKQIAVRLPDEVVDFIDREVDQRHVESRASFVLKALERERRRLIAARDAAILAKQTTADDDFDALAAHASTFELDVD